LIAIDTSVAVDFLRGKQYAVSAISSLLESGESIGLSAVTAFELLHPIEHRKLAHHGRVVRSFIAQTRLFKLNGRAAEESAKIMGLLLRAGEEVNALDVLIAGSALAAGAEKILSADRDFEKIGRFSDLKVEVLGNKGKG
jgi:predicted nucleic acid-binding protein